MSLAVLFGVVALALTSSACAGLSMNPTVIRHVSWAYGSIEVQQSTFSERYFVGLRTILVEVWNNTGTSDECRLKATVFTGPGVCNAMYGATYPRNATNTTAAAKEEALAMDRYRTCVACDQAAAGAAFNCLLALATAAACVHLDLRRRAAATDALVVKCLAVGFAGALNLCTTALSLWSFGRSCYAQRILDLHLYGGTATAHVEVHGKDVELDWGYGPGYICLFAATALKLVHITMHMAVPAPVPLPMLLQVSVLDDSEQEAEGEEGQACKGVEDAPFIVASTANFLP